jgi:hypothetical protein
MAIAGCDKAMKEHATKYKAHTTPTLTSTPTLKPSKNDVFTPIAVVFIG